MAGARPRAGWGRPGAVTHRQPLAVGCGHSSEVGPPQVWSYSYAYARVHFRAHSLVPLARSLCALLWGCAGAGAPRLFLALAFCSPAPHHFFFRSSIWGTLSQFTPSQITDRFALCSGAAATRAGPQPPQNKSEIKSVQLTSSKTQQRKERGEEGSLCKLSTLRSKRANKRARARKSSSG